MDTLVVIKLLHTSVWVLLAGCVLALPILAVKCRFDWVLILSVVVLVECGVLAVNHLHCPLTDLAARFTDNREANFDIYLPLWLARYNKAIFGSLFVMNEAFSFWCWKKDRQNRGSAR